MQVAGDPEALVLRRQGRELGARLGQRVAARQRLVDGERHQRHDRDRDRGDVVPRGAQAHVPGRNRDRDQQRRQRQREHDRHRTGPEPGHDEDRDEHGHDERLGVRERQFRYEQRGEDGVDDPEPVPGHWEIPSTTGSGMKSQPTPNAATIT